jgi:hypothetical protein
MKFLDRFERLVERSVEGGLARVLPRSLQPVQIAKAAARAMDDGRVVGLRGPEVPNLYRVRLAPADLARFGEFRGTLAANTAAYLAEYARQRGLRPVGPPYVELVEDRSVPPGSVRVDARFRDLTGSASSPSAGIKSPRPAAPPVAAASPAPSATPKPAPDAGASSAAADPAQRPTSIEASASAGSAQPGTGIDAGAVQGAAPDAQALSTAAPPSRTSAADRVADPSASGSFERSAGQDQLAQPASGSWALDERGWLVDRAGQRYPLRGREVVRLGRAADNDVILDADTISRHHAELRWQAGQWFAYDLGSTNGTTIAGVPLSAEPLVLPPGATLRLGDRALIFVTS